MEQIKPIKQIKTSESGEGIEFINTMETPEQKAERLGVPITPAVDWGPLSKQKDSSDEMKKMLDYFKNMTPDSICGGCGKEIYKFKQNAPCGRGNCPFGRLIN